MNNITVVTSNGLVYSWGANLIPRPHVAYKSKTHSRDEGLNFSHRSKSFLHCYICIYMFIDNKDIHNTYVLMKFNDYVYINIYVYDVLFSFFIATDETILTRIPNLRFPDTIEEENEGIKICISIKLLIILTDFNEKREQLH